MILVQHLYYLQLRKKIFLIKKLNKISFGAVKLLFFYYINTTNKFFLFKIT